MLTFKCLNPFHVYNSSAHSNVAVNCGHCLNCRVSKRNTWIHRLNVERSNSESCLFITLTYDNDHLPVASLSTRKNSERYSVSLLSATSKNWLSFNVLDKFYISKDSVGYVPRIRQSHSYSSFLDDNLRFGYVSKIDIQKFVKRLRQYLKKDTLHLLSDIDPALRTFRYFLVSEYGPNTYRPHYHGLLFFKSKSVASAVKEHYLYKSWRLCDRSRLDCQTVVSNAPSYVAKYINCRTALPRILQLPEFKNFYLFSKNPSLGCDDLPADIYAFLYRDREQVDTVVYNNGVPSVTRQTVGNYTIRQLFPPFYARSQSRVFESYFSPLVRAAYEYSLTGYLPNLTHAVEQKYHIFHTKKSAKPLEYVEIFSLSEYLYGIDVNRTFIRHVGRVLARYHLSVSSYISLYLKHLAVRHSLSFSDYATYQSERMLRPYGRQWLAYRSVEYLDKLPLYAEELPSFLKWSYCDSLLASYGLNCLDFYDKNGMLLSQLKVPDSELENYSSDLVTKERLFFTKRSINSMIYENS